MESAVELRATERVRASRNRPGDLIRLTKPRITMMVLVSAAAAYWVASGGRPDPLAMLAALLGIGLVAGGTSALNQLIERDIDARMDRTRGRPLPTGRVTPPAAAAFSLTISLGGVAFLALFVNALTALLAAIALASYVLVYTPLKRVTSLSTLVGAVPGALPIMGGWTAATGELAAGAWALFGILFFWQLPHFLALAWLFREDYRRGGLRMLGVVDPSGRQTTSQAVLYALALVPTSLLPVVLGLSGPAYAFVALGLSVAYVASAVRFWLRTDSPAARGLFRTSLLYLPLLLLLLSIDLGAVGGDPPPANVAGREPAVATATIP